MRPAAPVRSTEPSPIGDTVRGEFLDHLLERVGGDQAQVGAAGRRMAGLWLKLVTGFVQVDLAVAEGQSRASSAERHRLHAKHSGIELHGGLRVGNRQHQMVEAIDAHETYRRRAVRSLREKDLACSPTRLPEPFGRARLDSCFVLGQHRMKSPEQTRASLWTEG
jgi:hypothetical protein